MKLVDILKEIHVNLDDFKVGQTKSDHDLGITTTVSDVDPQTGRIEWDVSHEIDIKLVYKKLDELAHLLHTAKAGTELDNILRIVKTLRNKVARLI